MWPSEITKNGGIAICAPIAPYDATRKHVRQMIEPYGGFVLVHIATSVEVWRAARSQGSVCQGRAREFSKNSRAFRILTKLRRTADVRHQHRRVVGEEAAQEIILHLEREGFIGTAAESV